MQVRVTIPDKVWVQLATFADERGLKVSDLVGEAVESLLPAKRTPLELLEHELRQAKRNGWRAPTRNKKPATADAVEKTNGAAA